MPWKYVLCAIVGAMIFAAGCERAPETEPEYPNALLLRVPADTPYVIASGKPMPEAFTERLGEMLRPLFEDLRGDVGSMLSELEEEQPEIAGRVRAALDRAFELAHDDGLEAVGLTREDRFVFYGNGLMPVMRFSVTDPEAFNGFISEVLGAADVDPPTAEHAGVEYWRGEFGPALLAAGLDDDVFSLGLSAMDRSQAMLDHLFADAGPEQSLGAAGTLSAALERHGFLPHGAGYVDTVRITDLLIGDGRSDAGLLDELDAAPDDFTPACRAEIRELVANAPRTVFGYDVLTGRQVASRSVLELKPWLAEELAGWSAPVPGLGITGDARVAFGFGLDGVKAANALQKWFREAGQREFACAGLNEADWADTAGKINTGPLYMAGNPKGFVLRLDELEIGDLEAGDVKGSGSLVMLLENAQTLPAMARSFVPELQGYDIPADGTPVPLPEQATDQLGMPGFVAMTGTLLAISVGEDGEPKLRSAMEAPSADPAPLLHVGFDAGWFYGRLAEQMPRFAERAGEELEPEAREELLRSAEMLRIYGEIFDELSYRVVFTENGVEFAQDVTLQ